MNSDRYNYMKVIEIYNIALFTKVGKDKLGKTAFSPTSDRVFPVFQVDFTMLSFSSFLAYRIGESLDLPVHGKPYLSPHHSELLECLPTQYTGEEFRLSPKCMDDFRFRDVT